MLYVTEKIGSRYKVFDSDDNTTELVTYDAIEYVKSADIHVVELEPMKLLVLDNTAYCVHYNNEKDCCEFIVIDNETGTMRNAIMLNLMHNDKPVAIGGIDVVSLNVSTNRNKSLIDVIVHVNSGKGYYATVVVDKETGSYVGIPESWSV